MSRFLPNLVEAAEDLVRLETTCLPRDERQADSRARGLAQHRVIYRFNTPTSLHWRSATRFRSATSSRSAGSR